MRILWLIAVMLGVVGGAHAQASTIVSYCNSQYPDNSQGLVAPVNARNCSAYITNNLSTVPYQGQVSTVYPLVAMGANISGTVSATYLKGNGSQITGIGGASPTWSSISGIPTQVTAVSNSGSISLTNLDVATLLRGTAVSVTGNISVSTINGSVPTFGAAPSWYTVTNIPVYVQNVSNSGNLAVTNLGASAAITATNITASGALIGGPTSVTTLLATGLFTGQAGANITGAVTATAVNATTGTFTTMGIGSLTASGVVSANALDSFYVSTTAIQAATGTFPGGITIGNVTSNVVIAGGSISTTGTVSNSNTFSNYMREGTSKVVASTPTTVLNFGLATRFDLTLTSSTTISASNVEYNNANVAVVFACQNSTGGFVLSWSPNMRFNLSISPTQTTTASTCTRYNLTPASGTLIWVEQGARGVSAT